MCFLKLSIEFVWYEHSPHCQSPSLVCSTIWVSKPLLDVKFTLHTLQIYSLAVCFGSGCDCGLSLEKPRCLEASKVSSSFLLNSFCLGFLFVVASSEFVSSVDDSLVVCSLLVDYFVLRFFVEEPFL